LKLFYHYNYFREKVKHFLSKTTKRQFFEPILPETGWDNLWDAPEKKHHIW